MAADVGSLVRVLGNYGDDRNHFRHHQAAPNGGSSGTGGEGTALITRDFLGGSSSSGAEAQELDLDLEVPTGYEKRLDLKSGKVFLQRCNSPNSSTSSSEPKHQTNKAVRKFQDLNFPPSPPKPTALALFEEANLDLKLVPSSSSSSSSSGYQSVCTLDKVKSALERAERQSTIKKLSPLTMRSKSTSPSQNSSSSVRESEEHCEEKSLSSSSSPSAGLLFAAGCPSCLLYVLISKSNPKCPRCHIDVPSPTCKKPRLDLNISV
ncbi:uncharacterized protein LOC131143783 [Malania oleifera]|uniref:uncharacterized protein LOC131143783 n=1 Tax=Malania oleifera TaxID=397392 RepID=UPI0025AE7F6A|nr:uncharacterized protein LOC131143783 [Malania oleifera]